MNEEDKAVNTNQSAATGTEGNSPSLTKEQDYEAKLAELEEAKNKAVVEAANWKVAALKAKGKSPTEELDEDDETTEERMRRIAREELSKTEVARIDAEKEALLQKALKENKELKLAQLNKDGTRVAAVTGSHNENPTVQDTLVTPEQMAAFKAKGWSDDDIARYKKNLQRYGTR